AEGTRIAFTWLDARGNSIGLFDPDSGIFSSILPFSYHQISGPSFWGNNYILFSSDYSGIENLYILNIPFKKMYQVTSSRFGAYDPDFSIHTSRFIYTDSGADGFQIAEARIDSTAWIPVDRITDNSYRLFEAMAEQEKVNVQDSVLQHGTKYSEHETLDSVCKYSKLGHLFNFHCWAPVSFSAGNLDMSPGIMVLSQNDLSTMIVSAGYDYNLNEKTGKYYTTLSYKGLYPVLDFHFDIGNRAGYAITSFRNEKVRFTWQEMNLSTSVSIPWNFSFGNYYRYLTPSIGTTLIYAKHHSSTPEYFNQGLIQSLDYKLSFFQYTRSSGKDIYPRWGQTFFFVYRSTPFTKNDMGSVLGIETRFYFPGMFGHHGIRIYGAFQNHYNPGTLSYRYADVITYPRGYYDIFDPKIYSLSFNYAMPLFYPDWSLGSLLYFKRVRMNLFFDYAESWSVNYQERFTSGVYKSTGVELTTDFHLLRFLYPIALGMRSTYFPHDNSWGFELTYSISY
ncbi:MAG: hypothetical protein Q8867_00180, partial [Bacteroidota bacterium]|nr:hypothetical protein [Bacteroidota bacterium]